MPTLTTQVATQFSTGAGMFLPEYGLVLTGERIVSDSATVVVSLPGKPDQLGRVVYLDRVYDLALLRITDLPDAMPAPATDRQYANYLADCGLDEDLDAAGLRDILKDFAQGGGRQASRCEDCREMVFEAGEEPGRYCAGCGGEIKMPSSLEDVGTSGIDATIETIITSAGFDPRLARRGPYLWRILKGSATIEVAYHQDSGLVTGDAYLCRLPEDPGPEVYTYLLRENYTLSQLSLSTYGRDVVLSLLIYDRYLTVETALPQFKHLFERADAYDDVLVERYGGSWRVS